MFRTKLLLILPLLVAVTVGQANRGYSYYGTSNVRDQRPQPIYGQKRFNLPRRPMPVTGPITPASTFDAPPATAAPVLRQRPLQIGLPRPIPPPHPIRSAPLAVASPQPTAIGEPQPPVTEAAPPLSPVEISTPEVPILPEPAVEQPEHAPISVPASQPRELFVVEPLPEPVPTGEPAPVTEQPPTPEPIQPSTVVSEPLPHPEPISPPEPIRQPEPISQPEPIRQPEPLRPSEHIRQPEPIRPPEHIRQPEPISQPEPIRQPEPLRPPEHTRQPEPIRPPEHIRQPEPTQEILQAQKPSVLPERDSVPYSEPPPKPVTAPTRIRSINVSQSPTPMALPLLPKHENIRESDFVRHQQSSVPPMITTNTTVMYPTQTPSYSYPPTPPRTAATQTPPAVVTTRSRPAVIRAPGQLKLDFQCDETNGYYSVEHECDTYIECKQNRAMKYTCPDGLHFNPAAKQNEYPCAYPSEVKCMPGDQEQTPKPTAKCPNQYGFYSMKDGDCSQYIMCQEGLATIMNCPMGLVFNPQISTCDWPVNVPQCNPNVFKDFTCPAPPEDENGQVSDIIYKYRYEGQCKLYIACQLGHPRLLSCEHGLSFDDASQTCIDEDNVTDCSVPYLEHLQ